MITNDPDGVFQQAVIRGIDDIGWKNKYDLAINQTEGADGYIVIANAANEAFFEAAKAAEKPVTLVSDVRPDFPSVVFDNRQGILDLVRHLLDDCGRSEIVFVRGIGAQYDAREREAAFHEALLRNRLQAAGMIDGEFDAETAARGLEAFIEAGHRFNAVIASDYVMGSALIERLQRMDRDVPDEIAVTAFGEGHEAMDVGLTTVSANVVELGKRAMRQVIYQVEGVPIAGVTMLRVRLMVRTSSQRTF